MIVLANGSENTTKCSETDWLNQIECEPLNGIIESGHNVEIKWHQWQKVIECMGIITWPNVLDVPKCAQFIFYFYYSSHSIHTGSQ